MQKSTIKIILLLSSLFVFFLTGCGFFDKDNIPPPSPLTDFAPLIKPRLLWQTSVGNSDSEYLRMGLSYNDSLLFASSTKGFVTAIDKSSGKIVWKTNTGVPLSTTPQAADGLVVVASRNGVVVALHQINGNIRWKTVVPGEILSTPAINENTVIVKSIDGSVHGLSRNDGHLIWTYTQQEPSLILRGASSPLIHHNDVYIGFANGTLSKLNANTGELSWTQTIALPEGAFSIQRMIDIDADPIIYGNRLYAATYQGKIASLDLTSGEILWSHDISSYTGMVADPAGLYITDAKSYLWRINPHTGEVIWQQMRLYARNITAPASMNNYIVVGDAEGYLHWIDKVNGHFGARVKIGKPLYSAPVVTNGVLYALTSNGNIVAYSLS